MKPTVQRNLILFLVIAVLALSGIAIWLASRIIALEVQVSDFDRSALRDVSITVTEIDLDQGRAGQFFLFNTDQMDTVFGRDDWVGKTFVAMIPRRGAIERVRFWLKPGEENLGFGRTETDDASLGWMVGDELIILFASDIE